MQIGIVKNGERTGIFLNLELGKVQRLKAGIGLEEEADFLVERYLEKRSVLRKELLAGEWFERMKERIVYALERREGNEEALKRIPWEPYLDMAIVFYLVETPGGDTNYRVISMSGGLPLRIPHRWRRGMEDKQGGNHSDCQREYAQAWYSFTPDPGSGTGRNNPAETDRRRQAE